MRKFLLIFILFTFFYVPVSASDYENHWARDYISYAVENNLASGVSQDVFEPDRRITRAEFISLLIRHFGTDSNAMFTSFNDIPQNAWYFPYVASAEEAGIAMGYRDGGFHPMDPVSRQDAVTFISRAYKLDPPLNMTSLPFNDLHDISDYAKNYVYFAVENKIFTGYEDKTLKPKKEITRAESLVLFDKFLKISPAFEKIPYFMEDYPKISPYGTVNNITLELMVNTPCTIYYKAVKKDTSASYLSPNKEEINTLLAYIPQKEMVVRSNIVLNSYNEDYNIFLLAVTDQGTKSKIYRIKDVRALAYSQGDGSLENPYIISDENQLSYIRYCQNKHFLLDRDIEITQDWTPIDASSGYFGSLDGGGHTISGLKIKSGHDGQGLFSEIKNGTIKNLVVCGNVEGKSNIGIFAGKIQDTLISECVAEGSARASSNNCGGFVGINNGKIENCLSALYSVSAMTNAGGISGSGRGSVLNSLSAVKDITADMYAGGISGINNGGFIKNSVSASLNVSDTFSVNSGRITTNKEGGITENNYGYIHTQTNSKNFYRGGDSINGNDAPWNLIKNKSFYINDLGWDFNRIWSFPNEKVQPFILPVPKKISKSGLTPGITPYAPIKVKSYSDIEKINPDFHYLFINDVTLTSPWTYDGEKDFTGSFDGNGYTLSGVNLPYNLSKTSYSMFGRITDGIIRNLNIRNVYAEGADNVCVLSQENYGIIENCTVSGSISADLLKNSVSCGGLCVYNFGTIENCNSNIDFTIRGNSLTAGGISAHNEGFINNCLYRGKIKISANGTGSSSCAGGITGFNNEGFIYNCFANPEIDINAYTTYTGGIAGILNSGEAASSSSCGSIKVYSNNQDVSTCYSGGISGLSQSGLIFNAFSKSNIHSISTNAYCGGITGFNAECVIQCTYSLNTIYQEVGSFMPSEMLAAYAGGIAGYNETGFISDNAAINPWIISKGYTKRIANCLDEEFLSNNYSYKHMIKEYENDKTRQNGIGEELSSFKNPDFFFKPIYEGGKLGWLNAEAEEEGIWQKSKTNRYLFPVIYGTKGHQDLITPEELK